MISNFQFILLNSIIINYLIYVISYNESPILLNQSSYSIMVLAEVYDETI